MEQIIFFLRPRKILRTASGNLLRTISNMFFSWGLFALLCPWSVRGLSGAELDSHCPACLSSSSGSATREGDAAPGRSWTMLGGRGAVGQPPPFLCEQRKGSRWGKRKSTISILLLKSLWHTDATICASRKTSQLTVIESHRKDERNTSEAQTTCKSSLKFYSQ